MVSRSRRRFLLAGGAVAGGMVLGIGYGLRWDRLGDPALLATSEGEVALNAWIKIDRQGRVTIAVPRAEMGQGVHTSLPMLAAEELGADWSSVRVEQSPAAAAKVYGNTFLFEVMLPLPTGADGWVGRGSRYIARSIGGFFGLQLTGGSSSVRDAWEPMRFVGAAAREMLIAAAAARWSVAAAECDTEAGRVIHRPSGRSGDFAELAAAAAAQRPPAAPRLRDPGGYRLIGKPVPRTDTPSKIDGSAVFGIDVRLPDMLYAAVRQNPAVGGSLARFDPDSIAGLPGVVKAVEVFNGLAVIADSYWRAHQALASLDVEFEAGPHAALDSAAIAERYAELMDTAEPDVHEDEGDAEAALHGAATRLSLRFTLPFLAHATMEPMNCTARIADGACEVWLPNQSPTIMQSVAAAELGIERDAVTVHTTFLGGGFGRRAESDYLKQAVAAAQAVPGRPVKLIWSREEDMQHDTYRPYVLTEVELGLDSGSALRAWRSRTVSQPVTLASMRRNMPALAREGPDPSSCEGLTHLAYRIPHRRIEHVRAELPVEVGYWRSVGFSHNSFVAECAVDEAAAAAGEDPLAFRLALLRDRPRESAVLEHAARHADWGSPLPAGRGRGLAYAESFGSLVAEVAEITVTGGAIGVDRVVCVIDCGVVVNPDTVIAQMESGILYGLTAALHGEITLTDGRVDQDNFPSYPIVDMGAAPRIETYVIASGGRIGGVGECGTPPIAPAIANAVFAATGDRVRSLPIRL